MKNYNLLYVEDDLIAIDSILYFIEKKFNKVFIANDGEEALEIINNNEIDILLLDINIPQINGLQLAKKLRDTNVNIPILFLTAHSEKEKLFKALDLKVHGYLVKPLDVSKLIVSLNKIIEELDQANLSSSILFLKYNFSWHIRLNELKYNNTLIPLTKNEILLIQTLAKDKFHGLSFNEIKEKVFKDINIKDNSIVQLIARLKRKTKEISKNNDFFIDNIYQYGYKLNIKS